MVNFNFFGSGSLDSTKSIFIDVGLSNSQSNVTIPSNFYITRASTKILTTYSVGTTITVGNTITVDLLLNDTNINPLAINEYANFNLIEWTISSPVIAYVNNSPIVGSCLVYVEYIKR